MSYLKRIQINNWRKVVYLLLFISWKSALFSQEDSAKAPFLKAVSIGTNMGALFPVLEQNNTEQQLAQFRNVAKNSKFTNTSFTGYDRTKFYHGANFLVGAFIDLNPIDHKTNQRNKNVIYRFELIYNYKHQLEQAYYRSDSIVQDSLYSNTTGISIKDSTEYSQNYYYHFEGRNVGIGSSVIKYFREGKICRPYIGIGACLALSYHNQMDIAYSNLGDAYNRSLDFGFKHAGSSYAQVETYKLNNNITGMVYIPFGISLNSKHKQTHISPFIDIKLGCKLEKYPYPTYQAVPFISGQVGVKIFKRQKK